MPDVRLIAAVGKSGQLGLSGKLPWHDTADLKWFKEQTWGHVVVIGRLTWMNMESKAKDDASNAFMPLPGRTVHVVTSQDPKSINPVEVILKYHDRVIFVAGGEAVYRLWLPYVTRAIVTLVNYDGPADIYMPPLWKLANETLTLENSNANTKI